MTEMDVCRVKTAGFGLQAWLREGGYVFPLYSYYLVLKIHYFRFFWSDISFIVVFTYSYILVYGFYYFLFLGFLNKTKLFGFYNIPFSWFYR